MGVPPSVILMMANFSVESRGRLIDDTRMSLFHRFARAVATLAGSPWAFILALALVLGGMVSGRWLQFSETWQLVISTTTTSVPFLMVFLLQNTQNRNTKVIHLKLDELIRAIRGARNRLVNLENLTDDELLALEKQFATIREQETHRPDDPPRSDAIDATSPVQGSTPES